MSHYYGGSSVTSGVRRLNASSFKELVERYLFVPVQFPFTREEFWALPNDRARDDRKDSGYIVACSYDFEEGPRGDAAATSFHMVILDLDEGEFVNDFAESPETLSELLFPYSHVVWKTAKHRKEAPRLKVAVDVSPSHPSLHKRFVRFIMNRIGVPPKFKGERESLVLSQPQFRAAQFKGSPNDAVIAAQLDGIAVHESDLPDEEEEINEEIFGRTYACDREAGDDNILSLAYLPIPGLTVEDIREPLLTLDASCDRKVWTEVIAGLRHQFTEEADAEEAFNLFEEWSATAPEKYVNRRDCWTQWKSYRAYARGRAPITIRSLFKRAKDAGWENTKLAIKVNKGFFEWLKDCTDVDVIEQEGASRIAANPFENEVVADKMVKAWQARIKALSGTVIDKTTLKKEVARVRRKEAAEKQEQRKGNYPSWLQPVVFVAIDDVFHDTSSGVALKPSAFDRKYEKELMPKEETPANGKPIMAPSAYALNIMQIPRVDREIYYPKHGAEDTIIELDGHLYLNRYDRNSIPVEDPEFAEKAGEMFVQHMTNLGGDYTDSLIDYIAALVQHPGRKIRYTPCIQSAEGVGKGFLADMIAAVIGVGNVKVHSPEVIRSQWNDWMLNAQFHVLDEIHFPGERREAVMNSLKKFVTDLVITINQRNRSARQERNVASSFGFTNYPDALHLYDTDRRWQVVRSPIQTKAQVLALNASGHFERMQWLLTPDGAGGLRYWLRKRVIPADFPYDGPAPITRFRAAVVEESKNPFQIKIEDLIEDAVSPFIGREVIHMGHLVELVARGQHSVACQLPRYLTLMGFEKYSNERVLLDGVRGAVYTHTTNWLNGIPPVDFLKKRAETFEDGFA